MENIIKDFLNIYLPDYEDRYADSYGYGDGCGCGYGSGYGNIDSSGYGDGSGDGHGDIDGSGRGEGDGYGDGYNQGNDLIKEEIPIIKEYRKGFLNKQIASLKTLNKQPVYYINDIPCVFLSIENNVAKVLLIQNDFTTKKSYIAKSNNLFAHGDTKVSALQAVNDIFFASQSFEKKKQEFIQEFERDIKYPAKLLFDWHHFLTGSCENGRLIFAKSYNIDLSTEMTTFDFLKLTENAYNENMIKDIISSY